VKILLRSGSLVWLSVLFFLFPLAVTGAATGQPELPRVRITINQAELDVELASTPRQRFHGLSFRKSMAENKAMLFVYRRERSLLFTMRDTSIPLSIAFIDKNLVINEIIDMQPFEDGPFAAQHESMYALETNQGWFERHGVSIGDKLIMRGILPGTQ